MSRDINDLNLNEIILSKATIYIAI